MYRWQQEMLSSVVDSKILKREGGATYQPGRHLSQIQTTICLLQQQKYGFLTKILSQWWALPPLPLILPLAVFTVFTTIVTA